MSRQGAAGKFRIQPAVQDGYGAFRANDQAPAIKTLRCVFCDQEKQLDAFSKTQVAKATHNPYAPPGWNKKQKTVTCKQCTAKQSATLQCMTCTLKKPLEQFAKNQRKHAERARCLKCMAKREEEDMNDSDPDYSSDEDGPSHETWHDIM
ncbi:Stc1 domain-containing protein [Zychaea mexicana]|uniref:Stc1 domain-containing protein n=1 Tax=Zychaea mexicana TaxID=64656 RepID=UPI0022FF18B3|nr:Stc1 domain-containing protein [Zychaea mexicana]KAI9493668.1 Stc1 domain-containing protein [Zychaea mexicana]